MFKWLPVLKVWEQLHGKLQQSETECLQVKKPFLFYCKNSSRILLAHLKAEKNEHENFD